MRVILNKILPLMHHMKITEKYSYANKVKNKNVNILLVPIIPPSPEVSPVIQGTLLTTSTFHGFSVRKAFSTFLGSITGENTITGTKSQT